MEFPLANHIYVAAAAVIGIGLFGLIAKRNLLKKLMGLNILQAGIVLIWVAAASRQGATVPVLREIDQGSSAVVDPGQYLNPLPHTLMLTAIVVGVATTGVAFAMLISIHRRFGTLDEGELLERMRDDQ
jgi:multicomponent Na+:H+ antiporter subunit C